MSKKIKLFYALKDISSKPFVIIVSAEATCGDILKTISSKQKRKYNYIFYDGSELDYDDKIYDFWESSPSNIFIMSIDSVPPSEDFLESINNVQSSRMLRKPDPPQKNDQEKTKDGNQQTPNKSSFRKFKFYCTGGDKSLLLDGIDVILNIEMNHDQILDYLTQIMKEKVSMDDKHLLIYVASGVPLDSKKVALDQIYMKKDIKIKKVIYGVLTKRIINYDREFDRFLSVNVSKSDEKTLISPLTDSTDRGLCSMVCLLEYLSHDGIGSNDFLNSCASYIHFPPLITSLHKLIQKKYMNESDITTICSTLYTFFKFHLWKECPDNQVLEYTLQICHLMSKKKNIPDIIPEIRPISNEHELGKILFNICPNSSNYFWNKDIGIFPETKSEISNFRLYLDCLKYLNIEDLINKAFDGNSPFKPAAPFSMLYTVNCSIIKGKDHEFFCLGKSLKDDPKCFTVFDPMTGKLETKSINDFAKEQSGDVCVDPDYIKQIIMVNLDESGSMISDLNGHHIGGRYNNKDHRITIAIQYLTSFISKIKENPNTTIQGLVSFNKNVTVRCPLSPFISDFEEKGLNNIKPSSVTKLWDSISLSIEEIVKIRKDENGNEKYKNAVSRIIVISDGDDSDSTAKVEDVVKELLKNKIIVDSVIINSNPDECKMLCAVCHATGGFSFAPKSSEEGIKLFENEAFYDIEDRKKQSKPLISGMKSSKPSLLKPEMITNDFMNKAKLEADFNDELISKKIFQSYGNPRLITLRKVCIMHQNIENSNQKKRRIIREIHYAIELTTKNKWNYDPDLKIFPLQANYEKWKVFMRVCDGSFYGDKWWYLSVSFPDLYPYQPPDIRFMTIPFHLNVSSTGKICHEIIDKYYISSMHVVDILQTLKELFLLPNPELPLSLEILDMYQNERDKYRRLARESAVKNAKDDYNEYLQRTAIDDASDSDEVIDLDNLEKIPPYMRSQIQMKPIKPEKMIKASTGVYYDRDELKQIVCSSKNPICVITGKPLTERPEYFDSHYYSDSDSEI